MLSGKDGVVSYNSVEYAIVDWSLDIATDMVDTTMSKTDWKSVVNGQTGATGSLTVHCDPATHKAIVRAAIPPLTTATIIFKLNDTDGFSGTAYLSGMSPSVEAAGGVDISFNVQITGELSVVGFA
jgi:hypothetical protein